MIQCNTLKYVSWANKVKSINHSHSPWAETGKQMLNTTGLKTMPDNIVKQAVRIIKESGSSGGEEGMMLYLNLAL